MNQSLYLDAKQAKTPGFSSKIIRIYLFGASTLLIFYMFTLNAGIMFTENALMERRINTVAHFHFERFKHGEKGAIAIDPLLTIYDTHVLLPEHLRHKLNINWTGSTRLMLENDNEFQVVAARINTGQAIKIVYAVENSNAVEWDDTKLVLIEITIGLIVLMLFALTALYMVRAARRIALPFLNLAQRLENDSPDNFEQIQPVGEQSIELLQIIKGLNTYRRGLAEQLQREKSFTRYVSHELRTPMMIIKGAISNLRQGSNTDKHDKVINKIDKATEQMQELTQTFLMLAREQKPQQENTLIDHDFLQQIATELEHTAAANQISFQWQLNKAMTLPAQSLLVKAVLLNLLKNAFSCSIQGNVNLRISDSGIEVIDDGVGLDAKPRSHEGFGIGLVLVQDICRKYGWQFSLKNNQRQGCKAEVRF